LRNNIKNSLFFLINRIMSSEISDNQINNNTETDMMFNMFANSEKMVSEDQVQEFEKGISLETEKNNYNTDNLDDLVDSEDNYSDHNSKSYENNNNSYNEDNYHQNMNYQENINQEYSSNNPIKESKEDKMLKKLDMLRKLGELAQYGVKLSQNYNINSDYDTMKYEYELHRSIRAKRNGVNWMSSMMMNCVYGLEMLNEKYDPFSVKLKGWSEQMNSEQDNYYDVFGELYEKYSKPGKSVPPEIKLMLMISGSAIKFHLANTLMGSMPNLQEKFSQNPELAQKLREQAARDKIKKQTVQQTSSFNKSMNMQHDIATQKARDIEMLKRKKLEFEQMQQQQNEIIENKKKLDLLKKELEIHKMPESSQFQIPVPNELASRLNMSSTSLNYAPVPSNSNKKNNFELERNLQLNKHKKEMEGDNDSISISDAYTNDSVGTEDSKVLIKKKRGRKKKSKINVSTD
jgi:hypothetical protein